MMDLQTVLMSLLGIACTVLGWFGRELWAAVQKLKEDLGALEVRIGRDFVSYDRLHDALKPISDQLTRIENGLSTKADK